MKEGKEKEMECKECPVHCEGEMDCCRDMHGMHHGRGHILMLVGILALVYGIVNYLRMMYTWPPYAGWIVGGVVLIVIALIKKYWMHKW